MSESGKKHLLDKTESTYCSDGSLFICQKGSPYFIYLKSYLKGLLPCLGITLNKLHWFATPTDVYPYGKKPVRTQTFLKLLRFKESWSLIG